jgi:hypothetical protein
MEEAEEIGEFEVCNRFIRLVWRPPCSSGIGKII